MLNKEKFFTIVNQDADLDYIPFDYPEARGTGGTSRFGEIAVIRNESSTGNLHVIAFWRVEPATSPLYDSPLGDEAGMIIHGSATIELLDDAEQVVESHELHAGDIYNFDKGTLQRWIVHEPLKKFVTVTDDTPASG